MLLVLRFLLLIVMFHCQFFYIIVIVFRISATSANLNGYVLVSQMFATPTLIRMLYTSNLVNNGLYYVSYSGQFFIQLGIAVYAIWNLDFFRSFYKPICLHPDLTYQQVLMLDYAVAVYPMLLILVTLILVKLHDNFAIVVCLWRPFHRCLILFRKQWNIQSYMVNALSTFIVLSYHLSFSFTPIYTMSKVTLCMVLRGYSGYGFKGIPPLLSGSCAYVDNLQHSSTCIACPLSIQMLSNSSEWVCFG